MAKSSRCSSSQGTVTALPAFRSSILRATSSSRAACTDSSVTLILSSSVLANAARSSSESVSARFRHRKLGTHWPYSTPPALPPFAKGGGMSCAAGKCREAAARSVDATPGRREYEGRACKGDETKAEKGTSNGICRDSRRRGPRRISVVKISGGLRPAITAGLTPDRFSSPLRGAPSTVLLPSWRVATPAFLASSGRFKTAPRSKSASPSQNKFRVLKYEFPANCAHYAHLLGSAEHQAGGFGNGTCVSVGEHRLIEKMSPRKVIERSKPWC